MGKIILTVEGSTVGTVAAGGGVVEEKTVSETDSARIIGGLARIYGMPTNSAADLHAIIARWLDEMCASTVSRVMSVERDTMTVPPIEVH